jgi:hypothetical protein
MHGISRKRGDVAFAFSNLEAEVWGISRKLKNNALTKIEAAGLIHVERDVGKAARIRILEVEDENE